MSLLLLTGVPFNHLGCGTVWLHQVALTRLLEVGHLVFDRLCETCRARAHGTQTHPCTHPYTCTLVAQSSSPAVRTVRAHNNHTEQILYLLPVLHFLDLEAVILGIQSKHCTNTNVNTKVSVVLSSGVHQVTDHVRVPGRGILACR